MLRIVGMLFILIGAQGYSFIMAYDFEKQLNTLMDIKEMMNKLINYINYEKEGLENALYICSQNCKGKCQSFLKNIVEKLELKDGATIDTVWKENCEIWKGDLNDEEMGRILTVFEQTGFLEKKMQIQALERYVNQIDEIIINHKKNREGKTKIYCATGIMSGVLLCIILW